MSISIEDQTISRIISHLSKDISNITKWQSELSTRLCFLLGARRAIQLMLAVKDASPHHYAILNVPPREKNIDKVLKKVSSGIGQQGYPNHVFEEYENVLQIKVKDRKKDRPDELEMENIANKYVLDEVQIKGLPQIILQRQASINASKGADVTSGDIKSHPQLDSGEEVILLDIYYNVIGYGVAQMSAEEIMRSPGRIAIRTSEGRYDVPKYRNDKRYANGLYSITTLPRILGLSMLELGKEKQVILVVCQDNAEVAVEIFKKAAKGSKIYLLIRNDNHFEAVKSTMKRLQVEEDAIEYIRQPLDRFAKSRPKDKFTHFYLEMNSSETGMRPNPYIHVEEKSVIANARNQFSALRSISLIGDKKATIVYVTHSIDPTENEEVVVQGFRQGGFNPVDLDKDLKAKYSDGNYSLPEIPTLSSMGEIDLKKMIEEEKYDTSWINVDPLIHGSDAGFVAKFTLNK